jgi:tetratricopeptide (TPR) repeat protein
MLDGFPEPVAGREVNMVGTRRARLIPLLMLLLGSGIVAKAEVRVWEEELSIPTWLIGDPEVNPTFSWSSSRSDVYPYPYKEILLNEKADRIYRACWLENEFIKVLVLPEIGGRLHGAVDKTNNYNFFYWQPTIKPALVGMTGAWISGGIEWNFPHGHRPTGFSPVQYRLVENPDGSKTVWVGEPELVQRMRWIVGLTVYPGKSVIEAKVRLANPTPLRHSFMMWTTTAMNTGDRFQAIFPTRIMTDHGKTEYYHWPVHEGVDISWWKNVPNAASYFAVERGEFFGAWDHGRGAGTVITGNPHIVTGKKFWTWGTSPFGRIWDTILADGEGPYLEPQAGAYSDNQPDYHWIEPGDVKSYSHFFFPVRDIGPFKMANIEGALNLEIAPGGVTVGVYSTSVQRGARVVLTEKGRVVLSRTVDLDPSRSFVETAALDGPAGLAEDYRLAFLSADGRELVAYSPENLPPLELPEPSPPPARPEAMASGDELWHTGDLFHKFRNPERAETYFQEALRRDPLDSRSRLSMAELDIKRLDYESALAHLGFAEKRDPDNGRLFYLKALALEGRKGDTEAYQAFYRAVHFEDYLPRAYERLAGISLRRGNVSEAAAQVRLALDKNALNPQLWALLATTQRLAGNADAALDAAERSLRLDPLSAWGANEKAKALAALGKSTRETKALVGHLLHDDQTALEFSWNYAGSGLYADALELLRHAGDSSLVLYHRAYFTDRANQPEAAAELYSKARSASVDYSFAFRPEAVDVFQTALRHAPGDGRAHYYLGLIYAKAARVRSAIESWREAVRLDPGNARAWRNLGLATLKIGADLEEAEKSYARAFELAPKDSRILLELDTVREELGVSPEERLAFLRRNVDTVRRRDALVSTIADLLVSAQEHEEALSFLQTNHFNSWEGGYSIHNVYMEANIGLAEKEPDPRKALEHYERAGDYPANLEVAPREPNLRGFLHYPMALLHRRLGNEEEADGLLRITAQEVSRYPTLGTYYRALAYRELGQIQESDELLARLKEETNLLLQGASEHYRRMSGNRQKALGHFYLSKVLEAEGEASESAAHLNSARALVRDIERDAVMIAQRVYAQAHQ